MSSRTATASRRRPAQRPAARRAAVMRRRVLAILLAAGLAVGVALLIQPQFHKAVQDITLPLRHEDIIRQQAADKGVDAALIAAVIYAESHFIDGRTSSAGAEGLMQITPQTAHDIARRSGGTAFQEADLHTAQVNIAYGAYHLRYLLRRFDDDTTLALAAYNAGEGNVGRWVAAAHDRGTELKVSAMPFGETRAYVRKVLDARRQYRARYGSELGL